MNVLSKWQRAQHLLSSWRVWNGIAYFMLVAVVVLSLIGYERSQKALHKANSLATQHEVETAAARRARVETCIASIPTLNRVNNFVSGVRVVVLVLIANSQEVLAATPKSDPTYDARTKGLERLLNVIPQTGIRFPVPTKASCKKAG